jgi:hypothetical protein
MSAHSLEQRKKELLDLLSEAEQKSVLNKKDVESRMGKPDSIQATGSKEFSDRVILTTYYYDLLPGKYNFPNSPEVSFIAGGRALICFDERITHDPRGRLFKIRDDSAPLVLIEIENLNDKQFHLVFNFGN